MSRVNLGLPEYAFNYEGWDVGYNPAMRKLDVCVQPTVLSASTPTPPTTPSDGDAYIVPSSPTGVWTGHVGAIARYSTTQNVWEFIVPGDGWVTSVLDDSRKLYQFFGTWAVLTTAGGVPYSLPVATNSVLGGVKIGSGITINSGVISTQISTTVVNDATTARTLAASDTNNYIRMTGASPTLTVALNSVNPILINSEFHIRFQGTGSLTIAPVSGVTINPPSGGSLFLTTGMTATLKNVATDVYDIIGQTSSGV